MITHNIPLPRLLSTSGGTERYIQPISASIDLKITPLSYATLELPMGESLPVRGYVEMFTAMGSAGIFRIRSPRDAYGGDTTTAELEHAIVEVGDYLVNAEYDEMMAADVAMQTIFSHYRGTRWQLGSVSALGSDEIAVEANHVRILEAMLALLDQKPNCMLAFDFNTSPWTVSVVARGQVVAAEGRLSRNVNSANVSYDDTDLCTRVYYEIPVEPEEGEEDEGETEWTYMDASTISTYGIIERQITIANDLTEEEADTVAETYLEEHKVPKISVTISAEDLSTITGESLDTFEIGKLCRLALPDYGNITIEQCITGLTWSNVYDRPTDVIVALADEEYTAVEFLHDLDATGATSGGGSAKKKQDAEWNEYRTRVDQDEKHIELVAEHVDTNDRILQQAGLYLDSDGVLQYSRDDENMWASHLQVQANRISLVVEGTGDNAHIKPASIVASINDSGSDVVISADHVDIEGVLVSAISQLDTLVPDSGTISVVGDFDVGGDLGAGGLSVDDGYVTIGASTLTLAPYNASWQSVTIKHVTSVSTQRPFCYGSTSGVSGTVTGYVALAVADTTIYYLGRT